MEIKFVTSHVRLQIYNERLRQHQRVLKGRSLTNQEILCKKNHPYLDVLVSCKFYWSSSPESAILFFLGGGGGGLGELFLLFVLLFSQRVTTHPRERKGRRGRNS